MYFDKVTENTNLLVVDQNSITTLIIRPKQRDCPKGQHGDQQGESTHKESRPKVSATQRAAPKTVDGMGEKHLMEIGGSSCHPLPGAVLPQRTRAAWGEKSPDVEPAWIPHFQGTTQRNCDLEVTHTPASFPTRSQRGCSVSSQCCKGQSLLRSE